MTAREQIGIVQELNEDPTSKTGYSMSWLIGREVKTFPCTKEFYELQFSDEYIFPMITEVPNVMLFDENGVATGLKKIVGGEDFYGEYAYGCPKGFGYVYSVNGDGNIVIDGDRFNDLLEQNLIAHYGNYAKGNFPQIPRGKVVKELTPDCLIYCVDFYGGDRKQKVRDLWYLNDVLENNKNCYWLDLFDFWNGEGKIDMIVMFRQPPKDESAKAGNLNQTGFTKEYRFKEATGSDYNKEPKVIAYRASKKAE